MAGVRTAGCCCTSCNQLRRCFNGRNAVLSVSGITGTCSGQNGDHIIGLGTVGATSTCNCTWGAQLNNHSGFDLIGFEVQSYPISGPFPAPPCRWTTLTLIQKSGSQSRHGVSPFDNAGNPIPEEDIDFAKADALIVALCAGSTIGYPFLDSIAGISGCNVTNAVMFVHLD